MAGTSHADFLGVLDASKATVQAEVARRRLAPRDLSNPPTPHSPAGTLVLRAGGDYQTDTGPALLKKLILRRVTTPRGAFFHLPDYGLGLRVKEPLPTPELFKLKAELELQVKREPDVDAVAATVLYDRSGHLSVQLRVRTRKTGQSFDLNVHADVAE